MESKYHFATFSELVDLRNEQSTVGEKRYKLPDERMQPNLQSCQKNQT